MRPRPLRLALLTLGLVLTLGAARAATPPRLLVLEKSDNRLAIVDPASGAVLDRVAAGPDPHEIVASDDGRFAYISNYGGPGSALHTISVVDLVARKALPPIDLGPLRSTHGLDFAGGELWFTAETSKVIGRWNPASGAVDWVLGTGQDRTHMVWVSPAQDWIVTTNPGSGTTSLIRRTAGPGRPDGGWRITNLATGTGSEGFDVSPDGRSVWVAAAVTGSVSVIDPFTQTITATIPLPGRFANRLKFTPDGRTALVSFIGSSEVIAVDVANHAVTKRIPLGGAAMGILMSPAGDVAYVAHMPDKLAVIDLAGLTVKREIVVGHGPDGMAWAGSPAK